MTNYATSIDTVSFMLKCNSEIEQKEILKDLTSFIIETKSVYLHNNTKMTHFAKLRVEYLIVSNHITIASIVTGRIPKGKNKDFMYFIKIKFTGLSRHRELLDKASKECLLRVTAYLNDSKLDYNLTELDVAIDIYCSMRNLIAICVKRTPNKQYHKLHEQAMYDGNICYIEKPNLRRLSFVSKRSYYYNKSLKENLPFLLTRFETKLNSRFFKNKNFYDDEAIKAEIDRYWVMCFEDLNEKRIVEGIINNMDYVTEKDAVRFGFERYRVQVKSSVIFNFIQEILSSTKSDFIEKEKAFDIDDPFNLL